MPDLCGPAVDLSISCATPNSSTEHGDLSELDTAGQVSPGRAAGPPRRDPLPPVERAQGVHRPHLALRPRGDRDPGDSGVLGVKGWFWGSYNC